MQDIGFGSVYGSIRGEPKKAPVIQQATTYVDLFNSPGQVSTSYGNGSQQKLMKPIDEEHFDENDLLKELMDDDTEFGKKFKDIDQGILATASMPNKQDTNRSKKNVQFLNLPPKPPSKSSKRVTSEFDFQPNTMKTDDDFMSKVQKLKENYEKQKEKATSLEREDIKKQLQIEILVKRVHDIDAKKNEFKSELLETKRQNLKLRKAKA